MPEMLSQSRIVLASPGTGKTTAISNQVCELLENGVDPSEILCLTFTVKASENMRNRINEIASRKGIPRAKSDSVDVFTFHGFALDQLPDHIRFRKIATQNILRYSIMKTIYAMNPFNYSRDYVAENLVPKIENSIRYVKSFGILPAAIDMQRVFLDVSSRYRPGSAGKLSEKALKIYMEFFFHAFQDYEKLKDDVFLDFNDILIHYISNTGETPKYTYVFVDELQDVNDLQANIIEKAGSIKYLVGDRKQSIFGFQGGSLTVFNRFLSQQGYVKEFLKTNYRSTDQIVEYTSAFMKRNFPGELDEELSDMVTKGEKGDKIFIQIADSPLDSAVTLATEIFRKTEKSKKTTAIITRTNDQLLQISSKLDTLGVTYRSTALSSLSNMAKNDVIKFIRGIFSDSPDNVMGAIYTPFSGIPLRNAFEASSRLRGKNLNMDNLRHEFPEFFRMREAVTTMHDITRIFEEVILPISISMKREYALTVLSLRSSVMEFISLVKNPTLEEFTDFLTISEEEYESEGGGEGLIISTVHKAKGLEFDHVIYVPQNRRQDTSSFVDAVSESVIRTCSNIDISKELSMEDFRVDFVAMTRAKETLIIVTDERNRSRYYVDGICDIEPSDTRGLSPDLPKAYDEAYAQFVSGNYEKSKSILLTPNWLAEEIRKHFRSLSRISFSAIEAVEYPLDYLLRYILNVQEPSYPMVMGTKIHEIAEKVFHQEEIKLETDDMRQILENIRALHWSLKHEERMEQIKAEFRISIDVSDLFVGMEKYRGIQAVGVIDALFKSRDSDRYLIVDYKTDMSTNSGAKHRRQLLLYKMMLSRHLSISPNNIETAIAYLALREQVRTGDIQYSLDRREPSTDAFETIRKKVALFLSYRDNPDIFIEYLLSKASNSTYQGPKSALGEMLLKHLRTLFP